jgi:multiple sugar transport system substrate-binding protein
MSDPFAQVMQKLARRFEEKTGATVNVNVLGYPELYSKVTTDFVGKTGNYDLLTVDIVWSGEFAENGYTVPLNDLMKRDADELGRDDIVDVAWKLGEWKGHHAAYPLAGYANLLSYRKDLLQQADLEPPSTVEEMASIIKRLNDPGSKRYGIAVNGQQGAPVAQDSPSADAHSAHEPEFSRLPAPENVDGPRPVLYWPGPQPSHSPLLQERRRSHAPAF